MRNSFRKYKVLFALLVIGMTAALPGAVAPASPAHAQTAASGAGTATASTSTLQAQIDANNQKIASLNQQIATYQTALQQVGADKKTLQAAIKALDLQKSKVQAQVAITQHQISITGLQIQQLGGQIADTESAITDDEAAVAAALRNLQKADGKSLLAQVFAAGTLASAWSDVNATLQIEEGIQNQMQALKAQRATLSDAQTASQEKRATLTSQKQALANQQVSLAATAEQKSQLLAQTNAKESSYQKLLAEAEAELESFSAFTQNAGGAGLIGNQTVCDSWGCYYNQRDSAWGKSALNGTRYTLASDGCLVTSMAMMMTHYGYRDVTPVTINSNPDNFSVYYPAYLMSTIYVDGVTAARKTAAIDATLATGNPVVVGVRAYGGTHFVVLVSGRAGNYVMKDPYVANGNNISFGAHYTLRSVFAVARVVIS